MRAAPGRSPLGGTPLAAGSLQLRGRAARYAEVARKINAAMASKQAFDAVGEFAAACSDDTNGGQRRGGGDWGEWGGAMAAAHIAELPADIAWGSVYVCVCGGGGGGGGWF